MKKTFEKQVGSKKIIFNVEVMDNGDITIEANGVVGKVDYTASTPKVDWHYHITDMNFIKKAIGVNNKEVKLTHESAKDIWEESRRIKEQFEEMKKMKEREEYIKGLKHFELSYKDGEYLSGYTLYGETAEMLKEFGLAKDVLNWGVLVDDRVIKELGKEFTYNQLVEFVNKLNKEKEQREQEQRIKEQEIFEEKLQQAKLTGEPVELSTISVPCNDPEEECDMDLIIKYVNPAGDIITKRIHTW